VSGREGYLFSAPVAAGTTVELTQLIDQAGVIVEHFVRIYDGPETTLQYESFIEDPKGNRMSIIKYASGTGAKNYLDGNDDEFNFQIRVPVRRGDTLVVKVTNASAFDYDAHASMEVDYGVWARGNA
jgi:hypothetical protein